MQKYKEICDRIFITDIKDKSEKIHLPIIYQDVSVGDKECIIYVNLEDYKIGPIKITDFQIENNTIIFNKLIDNQPTRLKGKLRKKSQKLKEVYMDLDYCIIGPVYSLNLGQGIMYRGQVDKKIPHGIGLYITNKEIYHGPFLQGKRTGVGLLNYIGEAYYVGEFLNNKKHGKGVMTYQTDENGIKKFDGTWVEDRLEGDYCYIEYTSGDLYLGSITNFTKDGYGIHTSADGTTFKCRWIKGKRYGPSIQIMPNGTTIGYMWLHDMCSLSGFVIFADKEKFIGDIEIPDPLRGYGILSFPSGIKFKGMIVSRIPLNGWGHMYYPSGSEYFGEIVNDKRHGWGISYCKSDNYRTNGDKYVGMWANDMRNGWGTYYCNLRSYSVHAYWVDDQCYNKPDAWNKYYAEPENYFDLAKSNNHSSDKYLGIWQPRLRKCYDSYSTIRPILDHAYWVDPKYKDFHGFFYHD
jgi:hypothetical protein